MGTNNKLAYVSFVVGGISVLFLAILTVIYAILIALMFLPPGKEGIATHSETIINYFVMILISGLGFVVAYIGIKKLFVMIKRPSFKKIYHYLIIIFSALFLSFVAFLISSVYG